jgi:NAD(P)-dependent dehydrogenase (short-subunit alcohol dehydrogenase family)
VGSRLQRLFAGRSVVVTGGGSGIGLALGREMAAHGAHVVLADVDGEAAFAAASGLVEADPSLSVTGVELDVRDRDAFRGVVRDIIDRRGGLDYLVNNAGISMGGPTHELTGAHWDRMIEVNLTGVVNGLLATYPHMVASGRGHIVNVASGAGLAPPPFVVPYAATKHAVVELSLGLRPEAALHGVKVTVVCPGPVETPILDRPPPDGLPETTSAPVTARAYLRAVHQKPVPVESFATATLRTMARGKPIIVVPSSAKTLWYLNRLSPRLVQRLTATLAKTVQRDLMHDRPSGRSDGPDATNEQSD